MRESCEGLGPRLRAASPVYAYGAEFTQISENAACLRGTRIFTRNLYTRGVILLLCPLQSGECGPGMDMGVSGDTEDRELEATLVEDGKDH